MRKETSMNTECSKSIDLHNEHEVRTPNYAFYYRKYLYFFAQFGRTRTASIRNNESMERAGTFLFLAEAQREQMFSVKYHLCH